MTQDGERLTELQHGQGTICIWMSRPEPEVRKLPRGRIREGAFYLNWPNRIPFAEDGPGWSGITEDGRG